MIIITKLKVYILILVLVINSIVISGCWNYKEINAIAIVAGVAVDYDKETDEIIVTSEIIYPTIAGQEINVLSKLVTHRGKSFFDAARKTISKSGFKLFFGHAKVVIISEELASSKIEMLSILDWFNRDASPRYDIYFLVARDVNPIKILEAEVEIQNITSFFLEETIKNEKSVSLFHAVPLWEFIDNLSSEGISPVLPSVEIEYQNNQPSPKIYGSSIFRNGTLVGFLNGLETRDYLIITDKLKGGIFVINQKVNNKSINVSLEIFSGKTKIKPKYEGEKVTMVIESEFTVNIGEIDGDVNMMDEKNTKALAAHAEILVKNNMTSLIKKVQEQYGIDIFGFGLIIERDNPKYWSKVKNDWPDHFKSIQIEISVTINIRGSAIKSKPVTVGG